MCTFNLSTRWQQYCRGLEGNRLVDRRWSLRLVGSVRRWDSSLRQDRRLCFSSCRGARCVFVPARGKGLLCLFEEFSSEFLGKFGSPAHTAERPCRDRWWGARGKAGADPVLCFLPPQRASSLWARGSRALQWDGVSLSWWCAGGWRWAVLLHSRAWTFSRLLQLDPEGWSLRWRRVIGKGLWTLLPCVIVKEFNDEGLVRLRLAETGQRLRLWWRGGRGLLRVGGSEALWWGASQELWRLPVLELRFWLEEMISTDCRIPWIAVGAIFVICWWCKENSESAQCILSQCWQT